jgi:hypothetical protein
MAANTNEIIYRLALATLGGAFAVLLAGDAVTLAADAPRPIWSEVKWPFPIDQWGTGRAFRCAAADCGVEVALYLRAKIGFCNCTTGVSDDDELDRVGDLELFSERWLGLSDGKPITIGLMNGRSRPYRVEMRYGAPISALAIGFNDKCDVAVATVVAERDRLATAERLGIDFLNSDLVLRWAHRELGL